MKKLKQLELEERTISKQIEKLKEKELEKEIKEGRSELEESRVEWLSGLADTCFLIYMHLAFRKKPTKEQLIILKQIKRDLNFFGFKICKGRKYVCLYSTGNIYSQKCERTDAYNRGVNFICKRIVGMLENARITKSNFNMLKLILHILKQREQSLKTK